MRHVATTCFRLVLFGGLLASVLGAAGAEPEYRWRIVPNLSDSVNLTLIRRTGFTTSSHTNSVRLSSLRGLEASDMLGGAASFRIRRDAGTLRCKGAFALGIGSGTVEFEPDPQFLADLRAIGLRDIRDDQLFDLAADNFRLSTARDLRAACECVQTVADVIELGNHGVDGHYLRELARLSPGRLTIEEITQMKDHGVQISLLEALRSVGSQLPARSAIELQDHGVDPQFIREVAPQWKGAIDARDLIALHDHGVSPDFVRHLHEAGAIPAVDEIIRLHDHGTDPSLVRAAKDAGLDDALSAAMSLQDHGVDSQFVHDMAAALHAKVTADDLIQLHDHGVSPEFARSVVGSGLEDRATAKLIALHDHGVPPELIAQIPRSHRVKFSADEIIGLHDHGVDAGFLESFDAVGYSTAGAEDLIQLHDHGVTADFARRMQAEGFGSLRVSQLIRMKDHGL
ncbi:MAG: hypothetical protein ACRD4P_08125 [Bryobacteraceae bacterium]